ncbi:MAG: tRNA pseudouridine synthase A [Chlamydiia bacterium]|nr:tRNA pseudouridine synthase A [Chlamydiia bacterium]
MNRYKITIAYDGEKFSGWQVQPNATSIQELLESSIEKILQEKAKVIGSGRTDAGVHALAQVAHFETEKELEIEKTLFSLNGLLPHEIRILKLEKVTNDFHARFSAKKKTYHYHLHLEKFQTPFKRGISLHVKRPLDIDLLKLACKKFEGTHNFRAFANEAGKGSAKASPVKTIYSLNAVKEEGGYRLEFTGSGFLYKMVRNITGALIECASGKLHIEKIPELLKSQDRRLSPKAAPAHGLFLVKIEYD